MKTKTLLLVLGLTASSFVNADTIIFSDNFNSADNPDLNADLTRQSGAIATQNWDTTGGTPTTTAITSNQLVIQGGSGTTDYNAELDYNFGGNAALIAGGGFKVSFDLYATADSYSSFAMTSISGDSRPVVDASNEFGVLFQDGGSPIVDIREGTGSSATAAHTYSYPSTVEFTVTTTGITDTTAFTVAMKIDGSTIDLNGVTAGTDFSGTWGSSNLYMSFGRRGSSSTTVDNFTVTAIPELSTMGFVFVGCLSLLVFRKRK